MKPTYLLFGAAIAVSFGAGWILNNSDSESGGGSEKTAQGKQQNAGPAELAATGTSGKPASPRKSVSPSNSVSKDEEVKPEGETRDAERQKRREEWRKQMSSRMVDRQQKQFDAKIANLVEKLGLTPQQEEQLRAHYAKKIEAYEEMMAGGFEGMRSMDGMEKMAAIMGDGDLTAAMEEILTDEQLGDFEALKTSERKNDIESSAMKSMASLQGVVTLDDTQKDAVYDILYAEAESNVDKNSPVSSMMSAFTGGMMMNIDTSMVEQRMAIEADESLDAEQKKAKVEEMQQANIDAKVQRFDGILTETQQSQYRQSLESQTRWMRGWGGRGRR
ncbi:hypothetical protein [Rubritalea tangerina]|uniref:Uncharacterized protein n=1 Tax=Rubritalea tangerina TaxID=430798 RepID=A0ABW4Z9E7_9BACT